MTTARTAFYPQVNLTGSAGFEAPALNALIGPGGFIAALAAGLTAPIFDGGALRGALEQARGLAQAHWPSPHSWQLADVADPIV